MTTISEYLAEQKRLAEDATEGPWANYSPNPSITPEQAIYSKWLESIPEARSSEIAALLTPKDAEFIASARESVPRMIAALEAVMALHVDEGESQGFFPGDRNYGWRDHCCAVCGSHGEYGVEWPCPTIRAIEAALGGGGDGE